MNETINPTFPMQRFSLQQSTQLQSSVNRIKASVKNRGRGCSARSWTFTVASAPRSSARYRTTPSSRLANNTQSAHQWPRITSLAVAPPEAVQRLAAVAGTMYHLRNRPSKNLEIGSWQFWWSYPKATVTHNNGAFDREYLHRLHGVLCHGRRQSGPSLVADAAVSTCLCSATEAHTSANSRTYTRVQKRPSRTNSR